MAEQLASFAARLAGACLAAGLPVGPDRAARFAAAVAAVEPSTAERLRHCATTTLASAPEHVAAVQRALEEVLAGVPEVPADPADGRRSPARAVDGPAGPPAHRSAAERVRSRSTGWSRRRGNSWAGATSPS